jgi:tetratricopeptide (TPR) repeat protein
MLAEAKGAVGKQDYATALARLRALDRDAPGFQNVAALIADTIVTQRRAVETAIDSGQQNEQAGKLPEARRWYEVALQRDPSSVLAREKRAAIVIRMNAAAEQLYNQATFALKSGNTAKAAEFFKQIVDTTFPGDEFRDKATKQLDALKR